MISLQSIDHEILSYKRTREKWEQFQVRTRLWFSIWFINFGAYGVLEISYIYRVSAETFPQTVRKVKDTNKMNVKARRYLRIAPKLASMAAMLSWRALIRTIKKKMNISVIIANFAKRYRTFMFTILLPSTFLIVCGRVSPDTLYIHGVINAFTLEDCRRNACNSLHISVHRAQTVRSIEK